MAESAEQRQPAEKVHLLSCAQCGSVSSLFASGWRGCRIDDPETDEEPALTFFCPSCWTSEFGPRS
jgi:hypothetical protein